MGSSAQAAGNIFTQYVGMTHINSNASFNYYRYTGNAPENPTQNVGLANVIGTGSISGCSDGLIDGDEIIGLTSYPENHYTFLLARLDSIKKYSLLSATLETRTVNSISLLVNRTLSKLLTQEIEDTTLAILKVWQQRIPDEMNYLVKYTDTSAIAEITRAKNEVSSSSWDSDDKTAYTDLLDILYDLNQAGLDPTDLDSIDIAYIESMAIDSLEHASTWAKSIMEFYFDEPSYFSPLKQKESSNSNENKKYVQKVADKFSIFPNPSNSTVTFKSTENEYQNGEILIYSTSGQLVSTFPIDNGNLTFDLPVGSYFTSFKKIDGSVKFLEYLRIIQ